MKTKKIKTFSCMYDLLSLKPIFQYLPILARKNSSRKKFTGEGGKLDDNQNNTIEKVHG